MVKYRNKNWNIALITFMFSLVNTCSIVAGFTDIPTKRCSEVEGAFNLSVNIVREERGERADRGNRENDPEPHAHDA
jgi:hypothetical protein